MVFIEYLLAEDLGLISTILDLDPTVNWDTALDSPDGEVIITRGKTLQNLDIRTDEGFGEWSYNLIRIKEVTKIFFTKFGTGVVKKLEELDLNDKREAIHYFHQILELYKLELLENFITTISETGIHPTGREILNYQHHRFEERQVGDTTISIRVKSDELKPTEVDSETQGSISYTISHKKNLVIGTIPFVGPNTNWQEATINGAPILESNQNFIDTVEFLSRYAQLGIEYQSQEH